MRFAVLKRMVSVLGVLLLVVTSFPMLSVDAVVSLSWNRYIQSPEDAYQGTRAIEVSGIVSDSSDLVVVAHRLIYGVSPEGADRDISDIVNNVWCDYDYDYDYENNFEESSEISVFEDDVALQSTAYKIAYIIKRGRWRSARTDDLIKESVRLDKKGTVYRQSVPFGLYLVVVYNAEGHVYKPVLVSVGEDTDGVEYRFVDEGGTPISSRVTIERSDIVLEKYATVEDTINYSSSLFGIDTEYLVINDGGTVESDSVKFITRTVIPDYSYFDDATFSLMELGDADGLRGYIDSIGDIWVYVENRRYALDTVGTVTYYDENGDAVDETGAKSFKVDFDFNFLSRNANKVLSLVYEVSADFSEMVVGGTSQSENGDLSLVVRRNDTVLSYTDSIMDYTSNSMVQNTWRETGAVSGVVDLSKLIFNYTVKKILPNGNYLSGVHFYIDNVNESEQGGDNEGTESSVESSVEPSDSSVTSDSDGDEDDFISDEEGMVTLVGEGYGETVFRERTPFGYINDNVVVVISPEIIKGGVDDDFGYRLVMHIGYSNFNVDDGETVDYSYGINFGMVGEGMFDEGISPIEIVGTDELHNLNIINRLVVIPNLPTTGGIGYLQTVTVSVLLGVCFILFLHFKKESDRI